MRRIPIKSRKDGTESVRGRREETPSQSLAGSAIGGYLEKALGVELARDSNVGRRRKCAAYQEKGHSGTKLLESKDSAKKKKNRGEKNGIQPELGGQKNS